MSRRARTTHSTDISAAFLLLCFAGPVPFAGAPVLTGEPRPFELTKNSVQTGAYTQIGDLRVEKALGSIGDRTVPWDVMQKCVQEGSEWLRWADDGASIEMTWHPDALDTVLAAYCDDRVIFVGGYRQTTLEDDTATRQAWLFHGYRSGQHRVHYTSKYVVDSLEAGDLVRLNEIRWIDMDSGTILFSGTTTEAGRPVLLTAPFAIAERD